jgi:hypothetical protein
MDAWYGRRKLSHRAYPSADGECPLGWAFGKIHSLDGPIYFSFRLGSTNQSLVQGKSWLGNSS